MKWYTNPTFWLFIFFLGIDPAQTQDGVCGDGEQPNDGGKQL